MKSWIVFFFLFQPATIKFGLVVSDVGYASVTYCVCVEISGQEGQPNMGGMYASWVVTAIDREQHPTTIVCADMTICHGPSWLKL
jgi:hypothetical protein